MIRAVPSPPLSSHNPFGSLTFSVDTASPDDEPTLQEEREMRDAIAAVSVEEQAIAAAVAAVAEEEAAERAAIADVAAFIAADPVAKIVARTSKATILPNDVAMCRAIITNDPSPWHADWLHSAAHRSGATFGGIDGLCAAGHCIATITLVENDAAVRAAMTLELNIVRDPVMARAHELGSSSRRGTPLWTNARNPDAMQGHYHGSLCRPTSVDDLIAKGGFAPEWQAPAHLRHSKFGKFVSRKGSFAHRMPGSAPGSSMLLHNGVYEEATTDIKCISMGFDANAVDFPEVSADLRRRIIGACVDSNVARWLMAPISSASKDESALPRIHTFPHKWIFDSGATSHTVAQYEDYSDYQTIPRRWISGLGAYAVAQTTAPPDSAANLNRPQRSRHAPGVYDPTDGSTVPRGATYAIVVQEDFIRNIDPCEWVLLAGEAPGDPLTYTEAMISSLSARWLEAMHQEYKSLDSRRTWELVVLPGGRKAVKSKWLYKIKHNSDGTTARYKAHVVAKGFSQVGGIDYTDTFAPTVKFTTLRVIFSIAAHHRLHIERADVDCAFFYADLGEEIYMEQTRGFEQYGPNGESHGGILGIIAIYVDDIIIVSNSRPWIAHFKQALGQRFDIKELGTCSWLLGMKVEHDLTAGVIKIHQSKYIHDMLERFARTKHMDIRLHFVRDAQRSKKMKVYYVPTADMLADTFTKPLASRQQFEALNSRIVNYNIAHATSEEGC
eukprot:jgi/Tetstr1/460901/TSEL_006057.t1